MANFEAGSARGLEKDGIIAGFAVTPTLHVAGSGATDYFGQSINFNRAFRPKSDARFTRNMAGRFGDAEKLIGSRQFLGLKLKPFFIADIFGKSESRQKRRVKWTDLREAR